ncbi:MAG: hypothetical protein HKN26_03565 [Acidimicrobiales bacterium]|nr:hypothetical protein [Acidimicrobiales bacterium]
MVGPWYLAAFAAATGLRTLDYVMLLPPAEVCVARVEARQAHRFSDPSVTRKMHDDFAQAAISSRHVLTEGRWDPADTVEAIGAAREAGRLRYEVPS